jgi:hypothetical protein
MASVTETKSIPSDRYSSKPEINAFGLLAKRSNFQTTTTSTDPVDRSFCSSFNAARLALDPDCRSRFLTRRSWLTAGASTNLSSEA